MFTRVRPEEVLTGLLLTLAVFLLLMTQYLLKPVRDGLILEFPSGAEYKSYLGGVTAVVLLVLMPSYSRFASHVARHRLMVGGALFFALNLLGFYASARAGIGLGSLAWLFHVWLGVYGMVIVSQFWTLANDLYDEEQGKRLFPLIGVGASLGAALGGEVSAALLGALGRETLLAVGAALLVACAALFHWVEQRESRGPSRAVAAEPAADEPHAFSMVLRHRYLRLLALFSLVFTAVISNGDYLLGVAFKTAAAQAVSRGQLDPQAVGTFISAEFASFYFYANALGVVLQALVVSRLVRYAGLRGTFLLLPVIALLGGLTFASFPLLVVLRLSKIAEHATDYSANNTARHLLWIPTSRDMKYRAKQAVDTFFVRLGDLTSAALVATLVGLFELGPRTFAAFNVVLAVVWLLVGRSILGEYQRLSTASAPAVLAPAAVVPAEGSGA